MKFINVNGRILDYDFYKEEVNLMNKIIAADVKDYLGKLGFKERKRRNKLVFYNHSLDLEIILVVNKKTAEKFV